MREDVDLPNGGGGIPTGSPDIPPGAPPGGPNAPPGPTDGNPGSACPSAAYELVIESMTDCAFSCPISTVFK